MAMFQQSRLSAQCDECRLPFDPVNGGVCPSCNRLLCGTHMYGSPLRRLQSLIGMRPRCAACRRAGDAGSTGDAGSAGGAQGRARTT